MADDGFSAKPDIASGRLKADVITKNFADLHPPLSNHEARVEADRCYFCYDAPCTIACPTSIDIPLFIRQIAAANAKGAAKTIFDQNILGGMCARVCPTETLCEEACVREAAEGKPVKIGLLQRHATDFLIGAGEQVYARSKATGKHVAVIGAGPAGLACAHRLAMHGHDVTIFEARPKAGGLNEYGIAAYKTVDGFAQREVDYILAIGGISIDYGKALGRDMTIGELKERFDAVFLGMGLAGVNALGAEGEDASGVTDAVGYIAELRQAKDLARLAVARRVVVIGGGMTAIDVAAQSKALGAEEVTIVYRRGIEDMKASAYEQEVAQTRGVLIRAWLMPKRILVGDDGKVRGIELERSVISGGKLTGTGDRITLAADMVFKAIGQTFVPAPLNGSGTKAIALEAGRIKVDAERRTSLAGMWAGGDCIAGGDDLTVTAVADGRDAAESIHRALIS